MEFGPILRSMKRSKVRFGLLVLQVALTLAIVSNCVSLIQKARSEMARPSGFLDEEIVNVRSVPFAPAFREDAFLDDIVRRDLEAMRAIPGVVAASNTSFLPWQGGGSSGEVRIAGTKAELLRTQFYGVDDSTIRVLGNSLVAGQMFTAEDVRADTLAIRNLPQNRERDDSGRVKSVFTQRVVISKAFGKLAFGDANPLGRQLEDNDGDRYLVIGVMDPFYNPYGWPIHEYCIFFANRAGGTSQTPFLVRVAPGRMAEVLPKLEKALLAVNDGRNITVRTLREIKDRYQGPNRLLVTILSIVIGALLFVTSLGVVGLTSFTVAERTRQIGTRRALGARRRDILRYFLVENWMTTTLGVVLGVGLALALNAALMRAADAVRLTPELLVAGVVLLWGAGLLATFFPALRGARVAPAVATRNV